ncbi:hypothetical protein HNV12_03230 [Methanococcoides sp. SA1]|nr:hypothetical protein [Methanococcoides sp. SA1]
MKNKIKLVGLENRGFVIDNSKRKDYSRTKRMLVRESVAEALLVAKEELPKGYNFKIWDGKRSVADQRRIIKSCEGEIKKKFPDDWQQKLVDFTGGYKSLTEELPMNTHRHGGAVDLTIVDGNGNELDMGGDFLDEREALDYYKKKRNLTKREKIIKKNRKLLKKAMLKAGFEIHSPEWTHWGFSK